MNTSHRKTSSKLGNRHTASARALRKAVCACEPLESRTLLSVSVVASPVGQPGSLEQTVTATYTDAASPIALGSLNASNLIFYSQPALLQLSVGGVTVQPSNGDHTVVATYTILSGSPEGFTGADSANIHLGIQNVVDQAGNLLVPAAPNSPFPYLVAVVETGALGEENGSLTGSVSTAAASYNLTTLGTTDWAHWGTGNSASAFDHKATGNSQISNVTETAFGNFGSYYDPSRTVSWTDGTPLASDAGDHAYIWANGGSILGAGYSFTVAASTLPQTLYVYAGGYSSGMTLTAQLSDQSAPQFTATASGSGHYTDLFKITFNSELAVGETLTISCDKTSNINGSNGSVDLIAAALAPVPLMDTTPPTAVLTNALPITTPSYAPESIAVTYSDNTEVNTASLGNNNLLVTGPNGYSQTATLVSTGLTNLPSLIATYSLPAPAGGWSNATSGTYTLSLQANQVADIAGNFAAPVASLGTFTVEVPAVVGGSLAGSQIAAVGPFNLTTLGTADWAHWGTNNIASSFTHKATGGSQISNVTRLGSGNYGSFFDPSRDVTWTDGTPISTDAGDHAYIWANNAIGAGYSFTVPADTTVRTLYVYAGGYSSASTLTAHLSDNSASDYVATGEVIDTYTGLYTNVYAITYSAASAGQTLTISLTKTGNVNGTGGSVDLIAAALENDAV